MSTQTQFMRENPALRLNIPICSLLATNDGYWHANQANLDKFLDKYFSGPRLIMSKASSHVWVVTSMIISEFIDYCTSDGSQEFDINELHGEVVDWQYGGNRHRESD